MKVIIVGGVAGGASCAARLRRLDEKAEILMVERGPYVSYANCGLPYHVGGRDPEGVEPPRGDRADVPGDLRHRRADAAARRSPSRRRRRPWTCKNVTTGEVTTETYDKLVLSPGARSDPSAAARHRPARDLLGADRAGRAGDPGVDRPGTAVASPGCPTTPGFQSSTSRRGAPWWSAAGSSASRWRRTWSTAGLEVTLVEMLDQVMAPLDPECARLVERAPRRSTACASRSATRWPDSRSGRTARSRSTTKSGKTYPADIVILAIGVRPETDAGEGGRPRDRRARRHPRRRADAHERPGHLRRRRRGRGQGLRHRRSGALIPLAGPANRQGRIVADVIAGRDSRFRGTQGTSIIGLFGGAVGLDRRQREDAQAAGRHRLREGLPLPELARRVLPGRQDDRAEGPLPEVRRAAPRGAGARRGRAGGRQADRRARDGDPDGRDDLRPRGGRALLRAPFGSAKDPVNFAGMVAADVLRGDMPLAHWDDVGRRVPARRAQLPIGARRRERAGRGQHPAAAAPRASRRAAADREILVICRSAVRAYYATRILLQNGFKARNISGGMLARAMRLAEREAAFDRKHGSTHFQRRTRKERAHGNAKRRAPPGGSRPTKHGSIG